MSAPPERIIAARDGLVGLTISDFALIRAAREAMTDASNAINERDETIHALRQRLARFEALSTVEFYNCAIYVGEAKNAIEGTDRGRELARMIRNLFERSA